MTLRPQRPAIAAVAAAAYDNRSSAPAPPPQEDARSVLEAFYLGRAVASAVARRASEAVLSALAEIGAAAAEQPARLERERDAILREAREEAARAMMGGGGSGSAMFSSFAASSTSSAFAPPGGSGAAMGGGRLDGPAAGDGGEDAEAVADELRADVAECRALIRELREQQQQQQQQQVVGAVEAR
jgi:hypothetical protein